MSDDFFIEDLQLTKQFVMKELARTGNYAVVEPGKDAIYINKVDAKMKEETEKLVMRTINSASFIEDYENNPESNDDGIKKEISEATKDIYNTVVTVDTVDGKRLYILY